MEVTSHVRQLDRRRICLHDIVRFPMGHKCIKIYTRHSFCSNIQIQAGRSCLNMKSSWNPQRRRVERPYSEPQKATVVLSTTTCGEAVKRTGWYAHQVIIFVWRLVSAAPKATINPPQSWQEIDNTDVRGQTTELALSWRTGALLQLNNCSQMQLSVRIKQ